MWGRHRDEQQITAQEEQEQEELTEDEEEEGYDGWSGPRQWAGG